MKITKKQLQKMVRKIVSEQIEYRGAPVGPPGASEKEQQLIKRAYEFQEEAAQELTVDVIRSVNKKAEEHRKNYPEEASANPYVAQGILEELIKSLQEKV